VDWGQVAAGGGVAAILLAFGGAALRALLKQGTAWEEFSAGLVEAEKRARARAEQAEADRERDRRHFEQERATYRKLIEDAEEDHEKRRRDYFTDRKQLLDEIARLRAFIADRWGGVDDG
jgi:hypothetical protein